jgi:hypothetical protein
VDWFNSYSQQYYEMVGVVDILSPEQTEYRWDAAAQGYNPRSQAVLSVFRKKAPMGGPPAQ